MSNEDEFIKFLRDLYGDKFNVARHVDSQTGGTVLTWNFPSGKMGVYAIFNDNDQGNEFVDAGVNQFMKVTPAPQMPDSFTQSLLSEEPKPGAPIEEWIDHYYKAKPYKKLKWEIISQKSGYTMGALRTKACYMRKEKKL